MPKAAKKSVCETQNLPHENTDIQVSQEDNATSDQEPDAEVSFHPSLVSSVYPRHHVIPSMYMPYIEAQKWIGLIMMGYTTASLNGD